MKLDKSIIKVVDHSQEFEPKDVEEYRVFCIIAYLWILFFVPLIATKNSKYGKFHANQGLIFLIMTVLGSILVKFLDWVLTIVKLGFIGNIIATAWGIIILCYFLFAVINVAMGKSKELPFIGSVRIIK